MIDLKNQESDRAVKNELFGLVIIGAGPAGLAAAAKASDLGIENILIIERDSFPGGILPQCIHSGFGLKIFDKELTGPEYSQIFIDRIAKTNVKMMLDTMALDINRETSSGAESPKHGSDTGNSEASTKTGNLNNNENSIISITTASKASGFATIKTRSIILALGCRERTRGQIMLPGSRPAGVFTAGLVQRMVNIDGYLPGKEIVILGSGDIGLIMARRLTLEGCNVKGVYEIMPFSTGLLRNISQCLDDYDIPLYLSHTVSNILGNRKVEAVEVCPVDPGFKPVASKARRIPCDTLLLSVGLIPENELSKTCGISIDKNTGGPLVDENFMTSQDGIFSCGNSLFVYDIVDGVTEDGYAAAQSAADYLEGKEISDCHVKVLPGKNLAYIVPHRISGTKDINFKIRAKYPLKNAKFKIQELDYEKNIKHVNPGEMIFVDILKQDIAGLNGHKNLKFDIKK